MPILKGGIHIHTTCSDGELSPENAIDVYGELGYDFIAFTDHDHLLKPNCYDDLRPSMNGIIVLQGIELTIFEKGYIHVNKIIGDSEILHVFNHPADYNLSLEQVMDRIECIAKRIPLNAVEVSSNGFYTPEYDIPEIPYSKVVGDDSHTETGCGRAWIEIDCQRNKDAILREIKEWRVGIRCR